MTLQEIMRELLARTEELHLMAGAPMKLTRREQIRFSEALREVDLLLARLKILLDDDCGGNLDDFYVLLERPRA